MGGQQSMLDHVRVPNSSMITAITGNGHLQYQSVGCKQVHSRLRPVHALLGRPYSNLPLVKTAHTGGAAADKQMQICQETTDSRVLPHLHRQRTGARPAAGPQWRLSRSSLPLDSPGQPCHHAYLDTSFIQSDEKTIYRSTVETGELLGCMICSCNRNYDNV